MVRTQNTEINIKMAGGNLTPILNGELHADLIHPLGQGAFGTVFKAYDASQNQFAVKKISREEDRQKAAMETSKLIQLKDRFGLNDNIVTIHDMRYWERSIWIIMELCDLGDLNTYFRRYFHRITTQIKVNIMIQAMNGIVFLHSKAVVHRDIKPANILAKSSPNGVVIKLADFGLCKVLEEDQSSTMSSNVGTMTFKAPEFWDPRLRYHSNVDVYAAGLTFAAMLQAEEGMSMCNCKHKYTHAHTHQVQITDFWKGPSEILPTSQHGVAPSGKIWATLGVKGGESRSHTHTHTHSNV